MDLDTIRHGLGIVLIVAWPPALAFWLVVACQARVPRFIPRLW